MATPTTLTPAPVDEGHYAAHDRRVPHRPRVQLYRIAVTDNGLDVYAEYKGSKSRRVARWSAAFGLVAVGDNGRNHYDLVLEVFAAPTSAQALYAATTGRCARCNHPLEREESLKAAHGQYCLELVTHPA